MIFGEVKFSLSVEKFHSFAKLKLEIIFNTWKEILYFAINFYFEHVFFCLLVSPYLVYLNKERKKPSEFFT